MARLRQELDGDIIVYGSRRLSQALIERGLVDELRLMVYPLVLGAGDRLFGETQDKLPLRLVEARPLGAGVVIDDLRARDVVMATYRPGTRLVPAVR